MEHLRDASKIRTMLRSAALPAALGLGILADLLVRDEGRPGLNVALWAVLGVAVLTMLVRRRGTPASPESRWLVGGALFFTLLLMLRDAETLAVFSILAAVVLLGLAAAHATTAWASRANVQDIVLGAVRTGLLILAGPLGWGRGEPGVRRGWPRTLLRGVLLALPALLILTAILMSADPVFGHLVESTFLMDLEPYIGDLVFSALLAWLTAGFLRAFLLPGGIDTDRRVPKPAFSAPEITVALWALNLLFLVFMAVQLRYLFGGADVVRLADGLTYAEYARRGFFEMVWAAILVVPVLLFADWAATPADGRARNLLRASMLVLVVLLLGVLGSAVYRMRLYQDAYGLTEARFYGSAFILWLAATLVWLVLTVLRGRRERFVFGSILAGLAVLAALHFVNPDARIARLNLERAAAGAEYDGAYLRTLSADAVPVILSSLAQLSEAERCSFARMLNDRWQGEREGGWKTWNASDARARDMVQAADAPHRAYLASCPAEDVRLEAPVLD